MSDEVTQDFIFGTLATDDLRLAALRSEGRGLSHGNRIEPPDPEPDQPVRLVVSAGTDVAATDVSAYVTTDGSEPTLASPRVRLTQTVPIWDTLLWGYRREWTGDLPTQPEGTLVRYRVAATTADGEMVWADLDAETGEPGVSGYHVDRERVPDWLREAVIYHVFVDRFSPGDGRSWQAAAGLNDIWGGTIRGVTQALPYLADLGVTCLWLSPVFPSPTHHGYDATDYFAVEPRLGTVDDLRELFEAAHARGMRVLLDFVANHVSDEHQAFRRALVDPVAPERNWFTFGDFPHGYRSFFGVATMPRLDTEHSGARSYLIEAAAHWLRLGADGFRLDYANGPSHEFWSAFRAATRAVKPDAALFGEVVETAELQRSYQGRLDGTLDFLLLQQMRAFFAFETISGSTFASFLDWHLAYFPDDFVLPSFLDNHDMNRFLWVARGDHRRLKMAALCQFALPHPPIIYYGTEVGLSQWRDLTYPDGSRRLEESRTPMPWGNDQDQELHNFFRRLIAARRSWPDLRRSRRRSIVTTGDDHFVLGVDNGHRSGIIAVNRSTSARRFDVPPGSTVLVATEAVELGTGGELELPAMAAVLLL